MGQSSLKRLKRKSVAKFPSWPLPENGREPVSKILVATKHHRRVFVTASANSVTVTKYLREHVFLTD
jgi:hypothetical protein